MFGEMESAREAPERVEQPAETPQLDALLAEFESSSAINKAPSPAADDAKTQAGPVATPENKPEGQQNAQAVDIEPTKQELHDFLYRAGAKYQEILNERQHEVAQRDFENVVNRVQKAVTDAGVHVPKDYAETFLKARALEDRELVAAFDNRAQNPRQFNQVIAKFERGLISKAREDHAFAEGASVKADKDLVAAALRGASTGKMPEEPKPNLGSMNDAEYSKYKASIGL